MTNKSIDDIVSFVDSFYQPHEHKIISPDDWLTIKATIQHTVKTNHTCNDGETTIINGELFKMVKHDNCDGCYFQCLTNNIHHQCKFPKDKTSYCFPNNIIYVKEISPDECINTNCFAYKNSICYPNVCKDIIKDSQMHYSF